MIRTLVFAAVTLSAPLLAWADGVPADWPTYNDESVKQIVANKVHATNDAKVSHAKHFETASDIFSAASVFVKPEQTTAVKVSNRDLNRIVCNSPPEEVFYSKEKPMTVSTSRNNIFIKFLVQRQGDRDTLSKLPADIHVVCEGEVYTLVLHPKDMDSVTVHLGASETNSIRENAKRWGALPFEERVKRVTESVYKNETPPGFNRRSFDKQVFVKNSGNKLIVQALHSFAGTGSGLVVKEYEVTALAPVTLDERAFLIPELGDILAVTVDPPVIEKTGGKARLIIVERAPK